MEALERNIAAYKKHAAVSHGGMATDTQHKHVLKILDHTPRAQSPKCR